MSEHKFDEILDYLCSGIISKKEKQAVRDELYDHLMTEYEINLACGMSENQAAEAAESGRPIFNKAGTFKHSPL